MFFFLSSSSSSSSLSSSTHLAGVLADEQAVARAPHVLPPLRGVPDGRGLPAEVALDHVLVPLAGDVDGGLAHAARHGGGVPGQRVVVGRQVEAVHHHHLLLLLAGGGRGRGGDTCRREREGRAVSL